VEKIKTIAAIKEYFGYTDSSVLMKEMQALSKDERDELGKLAATQLGKEWSPV
jgi:hypothetical protein